MLISYPQGARCENARPSDPAAVLPDTKPWINDSWQRGSNSQILTPANKGLPFRMRVSGWFQETLSKRNSARNQRANLQSGDSRSRQNILEEEQEDAPLFFEDREDCTSDIHQPTPALPIFGGAIHSILSDPARLKHITGKAIQFSILWYLATTIAKVVGEAIEELSAETHGNSEPHFCHRSDIPKILQYLEGVPSSDFSSLPRASLELALNLRAAGLPIRSGSFGGRTSIESLFLHLTRAEASILQQCLWKPPTSVRHQPNLMWDSVVGLDEVKERLLLTVASSSPFPTPDLGSNKTDSVVRETQKAYASLLKGTDASSTSQHHGVLLFGEPGCGKSFLVQSLAAKLQWPCLVVSPSVLMRKYVGDTNLQVRALFSLLQNKLSPCIVILDELDGLFRERHDQENDASRELKTEFLQWMSGMMAGGGSRTENRHPPVIVGATNRPSDVDSAVLRRLPQRFYIGPPNYTTRCQVFQRMLQDVPLAEDFDINFLSQRTERFTPSDIQQLLQTAARGGPLKEAMLLDQQQNQQQRSLETTVRPLTTGDVLAALSHIDATPLSRKYRRALEQFANMNIGNRWGDDGGAHDYHPAGHHYTDIGTTEVSLHDMTAYQPYQEQDSDLDYNENYDIEDSCDEEEDDDEL